MRCGLFDAAAELSEMDNFEGLGTPLAQLNAAAMESKLILIQVSRGPCRAGGSALPCVAKACLSLVFVVRIALSPALFQLHCDAGAAAEDARCVSAEAAGECGE